MMTVARWKIAGMALLAGIAGLGIASAGLIEARTEAPPCPEPARAILKPADDPPPKPKPKPKEKPAQPAEVDPLALMVPRDVSATAGAGTIRMYALDAKGDRIEEPQAEVAPSPRKDRIIGKIQPWWKEADVDVQWVAIVGTLDNRAIREALARSRKADFSETAPRFKRAELHPPGPIARRELVGMGRRGERRQLASPRQPDGGGAGADTQGVPPV